MAKRHVEHEHENHERWLVSYADFITLLFAFFVVMYSVSSVNEGKMKVLSDAMSEEFRTQAVMFPVAPHSLKPVAIGEISREQPSSFVDGPKFSPGSQSEPEDGNDSEKDINAIKIEIEENLSDLIGQKVLKISDNGRWLEIEINSHILFNSGEAEPIGDANKILMQLAQILNKNTNSIRVEGFTDDVPIKTVKFPSNWELSAARAARVVIMLAQYGVDPIRMAAVGYGEYQPVAENRSSEGRAKNRRVVLVISKSSLVRERLDSSNGDIDQMQKLPGEKIFSTENKVQQKMTH